jgi:KAT8 regulatory NSL complex subunit 1
LRLTFRLLPKETETTKSSGSGGDELTSSTGTAEISGGTVVSSTDTLNEIVDQQQLAAAITITDDAPKLEQYILESMTSSSSTSITSSLGFQSDSVISTSNSQSTQNDQQEMPQLLNILNELLDGQDLSQLANSGANIQDNMPDVDQEENYEDESPRKDEEELARMITQQRREEICREELQLRRRMDFLIRRLYKFVARSTGLHASEEIAGFLEHVARYSKKKEKSLIASKFPYLSANLQGLSTELLTSPAFTSEPPINLLSSPSTSKMSQESQINSLTTTDVIEPSPKTPPPLNSHDTLKSVPYSEMKSFMRRINNISTMQSTVLTKRELAFKFFSTKSSQFSHSNLNQASNFESSAIPKLEDADVDQVEQTSGLLLSELRMIENQVDSDATASSTGGESADEMIIYNNHIQQPLSM